MTSAPDVFEPFINQLEAQSSAIEATKCLALWGDPACGARAATCTAEAQDWAFRTENAFQAYAYRRPVVGFARSSFRVGLPHFGSSWRSQFDNAGE
jgi:hypothetical protein